MPKRSGISLLVDSMVTGGFAQVLIAMIGCNSSQYLHILERAPGHTKEDVTNIFDFGRNERKKRTWKICSSILDVLIQKARSSVAQKNSGL